MDHSNTTGIPLQIIRQDYGHFHKHARIGPAVWPHFDLLWIHQGGVDITVGSAREPIRLTAPNGILIFPNCHFEGKVQSHWIKASITHFQTSLVHSRGDPNFLSPSPDRAPTLQKIVELSQTYAQQGVPQDVRLRLLIAILDAFLSQRSPSSAKSRIQTAWDAASADLSGVRTLADVGAIAQLSESAFRTLYRRETGISAGRALTELRISSAEKLLGSSSMSITQIAREVGYGSPESLTRAFKRLRKIGPTAYRAKQEPFG